MQVVLDTYGLSLSVRNGCFLIASKSEKRMVHPDRITSILVTMPCRISSPAILLAATCQINLVICTRTGKPEARLWTPRFLNTSTLRRKQYGFSRSSSGFKWVQSVILQKLTAQLANLRFVTDRKPAEKEATEHDLTEIEQTIERLKAVDTYDLDCLKTIRYFEASVAQQYWTIVGKRMPGQFNFEGRTKRNPTDPFNACINYLYGMLRNQIETAILSIGLDPALGIMHRDGYKLPSLVFDLIEPFRPIADRILIDAIIAGKLQNVTEEFENGSVRINQKGRKALITMFNEKLNKTSLYKNTKASLLNHILLETRQLADKIKQYGN